MGIMAVHSTPAQAQQEMGSLVYYDVPKSEYTEHSDKWRVFLEYNLHREQCQNYVAPPEGYVMKGCQVYRVETVTTTTAVKTEMAVTKTAQTTVVPAIVASSHTIFFAHDRSDVPANEEAILDNVVQDIQKHNPATVIVSGYTSTTGTADYNMALSQRRAAAVAKELVKRGVAASIIDQEAYGKTHLAVPTADDVKMPANRRVVIEFNE